MSSILHNVPDVTTFAANVVVFLAAISAAVVGSMSAVKAIKKSLIEGLKPDEPVAVTKTQVIGGVLQDLYGSQMMVAELARNTQAINESAEVSNEVKVALNMVCEQIRELRHQNDRLIDAIRSNNNGR